MDPQQGATKRFLSQIFAINPNLSLTKIVQWNKMLVRLLLLLILLRMLQPAPVLITTGPSQTVITQHPRLGVHTRLTDEVVDRIRKDVTKTCARLSTQLGGIHSK